MPTCGECEHWQHRRRNRGECKAGLPVIVMPLVKGIGKRGCWPIVGRDERSCGQFKPGPPRLPPAWPPGWGAVIHDNGQLLLLFRSDTGAPDQRLCGRDYPEFWRRHPPTPQAFFDWWRDRPAAEAYDELAQRCAQQG